MTARKKGAVAEVVTPVEPEPIVLREAFTVVASDTESPTDECVCCHHRHSHSGKGVDKRCTMHVFGFGKCDCAAFRMKVKR